MTNLHCIFHIQGYCINVPDEIPPSVCEGDPECTANRPESAYSTAKVVQLLVIHLGPVLIVGGLVGNVLAAIVVTCSRRLWPRTASLYILVLAVVDSTTLVLGLGDYVLFVNGIHLRAMGQGSCKALIFRFYFLKMLEAWVLVNMNLERFAAVYVPHKVRLLFTKRRAGVGLVITTLGVLALNLVYIPTFELREGKYCQVKVQYNSLMTLWYWVDLCLASVFPFLVMTSCSVAIVIRIVYTKEQWRHMQILPYIKISSMTISMLLVALCFLLLTAPLTILSPMLSIYHESLSTGKASKYATAFHLINFCLYINYVINFYIYCVSNPVFRQEFSTIICRQNKNSMYVVPMSNRSSQTSDVDLEDGEDAYRGTHL